MKHLSRELKLIAVVAGLAGTILHASAESVGISPWGAKDEIGTLNLMTEPSRLEVLSRINSGKVYDLSVEYFVGMPSFHHLGDPGYQIG